MVKNNPFIPGDPIIKNSDFFGRKDELEIVLDCIVNQRNVIITGDRGIGKTSLANQVVEYLHNERLGFVASYACTKETSLNDICEGLLNSLKRILIDTEELTERKLKIKFEIPKFISIEESSKYEKIQYTNILNRFIDTIVSLSNKFQIKNEKICFFIDEIDVLKEVDISSFIKTTKEHLQRERINNVAFLLVGQRGHIYKLIEKHPSIGRTLTTVIVPLMNEVELRKIIDNGEEISRIRFDEGVKKGIIDLSNGFPSVTQFLSYYALFKDKDGFVDYFDFENGLNLAIEKLNFERYIEPIKNSENKETCRKILEIICLSKTENISNQEILQSVQIEEKKLYESLTFLNEQGLVYLYDNGTFALKDRLIAVYYNLKNLNKRTTDFISLIINILQVKGFSTQYVGTPTQRNIDIIATKKIPVWGGLFTRKRKFGVICIPNSNSISVDLLKYYSDNVRQMYLQNKLDEILIVGDKNLTGSKKLQIQSSFLNYFSIEFLHNANLDYY